MIPKIFEPRYLGCYIRKQFFKGAFRVFAAAVGFLLLITVILLLPRGDPLGKGTSKLPVGPGTPCISLGERHGLILASDGSLWSWGSDFLGWPVLGLGAVTNQTISLRQIGNDTRWSSISVGENHNLALKSDGSLWTWGEIVAASNRLVSISIPTLITQDKDWKQAAAGGIHCLAIKTNGTLWGWGNNWAGSVGIASTNGSAVPVQIGSATNWVRVWAGLLESVGLQSDGSLWYWGENPDPNFNQGVGFISQPTRISPDTNWVDVGFGVNTMFAIKADGSLWALGRNAHYYTGGPISQNTKPLQVGTETNWKSFSAVTGWWITGLTKQDGSLWLMDATQADSNGPRVFERPAVLFKKLSFPNTGVASACGSVHGAGPGVHGPISVMVTQHGEVWTSGMVLGDPLSTRARWEKIMFKIARMCHIPASPPDPPPVYRDKPWRVDVTR